MAELQSLPPEYQLYEKYRRLREASPVHVLDAPGGHRYCVLRYDDVAAAFKDPRFRAAKTPPEILAALRGIGLGSFASIADSGVLVTLDAPEHTRLRRLVEGFFRNRPVQRLRERIEGLADELLDRQRGARKMDLVADFAAVLPTMVITELMGFPLEDHLRLKRWSDDLAPMLDTDIQVFGLARAVRALRAFRNYLGHVVAERRRTPRNDLVSALVQTEPGDRPLDDVELLGMCVFILGAGHVTTTNLITNGMLALLRNPEQMARLRANPALLESAVEEVLRFESPIQRTGRVLSEEVRIGDMLIPSGVAVRLMIGSANHDPRRFANPDTFDVGRVDNRHVGFGGGAHVCLGLHLARLEGQVALDTLLRRSPRIALATNSLKWLPGEKLRGLKSLPIRVEVDAAI